MSGKHDRELEDKFAANAVSFKAEPVDFGPAKNKKLKNDFDEFTKMQNLGSEVAKVKAEQEKNKPDSYIQRKVKRIFGALGDVKTIFF